MREFPYGNWAEEMEDALIHEKYRQLAYAILIQAIQDYCEGYMTLEWLTSWVNSCDYFDYLGVDRKRYIDTSIDLKKRGIKKIGTLLYGKSRL